MKLKLLLTLHVLPLTLFLQAQTGTIKIKKSDSTAYPEFTFKLLDRCVGQNIDSAVKWVAVYGFKEGEPLGMNVKGDCGDPHDPVKPKTKLYCRYFHNDSIDLVLTYTKKKQVYCMLIHLVSANHTLAERLLAGSLAQGYHLTQPERPDRHYKFTEKQSRLGTFCADKGVWTFNLKDRGLVKK
jgi:hypothetical protein